MPYAMINTKEAAEMKTVKEVSQLTENIDAVGGKGTAVFAGKAIAVYCQKP